MNAYVTLLMTREGVFLSDLLALGMASFKLDDVNLRIQYSIIYYS